MDSKVQTYARTSESEKNKSIIIDESMMEKRLVLTTRGFWVATESESKEILGINVSKEGNRFIAGHLFHHS